MIFEKPINDGSMGCEPGHWSEDPTFLYTFIDTDGQILQQGSASTYSVPETELSHKILCQVQAVNAGGTGIGRTPGLSALAAAPAPAPPPTRPATEANDTTTSSTPPTPLTSRSSEVSLAGTQIRVQSGGMAAVKLTCTGMGTCSGKLKVTSTTTKGKGKRAVSTTKTVGTAAFSIVAGKTATVAVKLDVVGRALLKKDRGRLDATLTILESFVGSTTTRRESVRLVLQKTHGAG